MGNATANASRVPCPRESSELTSGTRGVDGGEARGHHGVDSVGCEADDERDTERRRIYPNVGRCCPEPEHQRIRPSRDDTERRCDGDRPTRSEHHAELLLHSWSEARAEIGRLNQQRGSETGDCGAGGIGQCHECWARIATKVDHYDYRDGEGRDEGHVAGDQRRDLPLGAKDLAGNRENVEGDHSETHAPERGRETRIVEGIGERRSGQPQRGSDDDPKAQHDDECRIPARPCRGAIPEFDCRRGLTKNDLVNPEAGNDRRCQRDGECQVVGAAARSAEAPGDCDREHER